MRPNVDTTAKAFALSVFVVLTAVCFAGFTLIDATGNTLLIIAGALIFATYWVELYGFNRFHEEIGAVTRPFRTGSGADRA